MKDLARSIAALLLISTATSVTASEEKMDSTLLDPNQTEDELLNGLKVELTGLPVANIVDILSAKNLNRFYAIDLSGTGESDFFQDQAEHPDFTGDLNIFLIFKRPGLFSPASPRLMISTSFHGGDLVDILSVTKLQK